MKTMKYLRYTLPVLLLVFVCLFCGGCGHEASPKELAKLEKQATRYLKKTYPDQTFTVQAENAVSSGNGLPTTVYQLITATDEDGITFRVYKSKKKGWSDDYESTKEHLAWMDKRKTESAMQDKYSFLIYSSHNFWDALDTLRNDARPSENLSAINNGNFIAYYTFRGTDSESVETLTYQTDEIPCVARSTIRFDCGDEEGDYHALVNTTEQNELMEKLQSLKPFHPIYPEEEDSVYYDDAIVFWTEDGNLYCCVVENIM